MAHTKGGKPTALAVRSSQHTGALPRVPMMEEAGGAALKGSL